MIISTNLGDHFVGVGKMIGVEKSHAENGVG